MSTTDARARSCAAVLLASLLSGCANGDFDRIKPALVTDDIHAWIGTAAARGQGVPVSDDPLTDDEQLLRDLAYPLIDPPYNRGRWYAVLREYGVTRLFRRDWSQVDPRAYGRALFAEPVRSQAARYARLNDDIRNDGVRIQQFFSVARRVLDLDRRRASALVAVTQRGEPDAVNAAVRTAENGLVISWVQWSLASRALSYRHALERLALAAPMTGADEVERSLIALQRQIAAESVLPRPNIAPGSVTSPFQGPGSY